MLCSWFLLLVYRRQEVHRVEPLVPDPRPFKVEIAIAKFRKYKSPGYVCYPSVHNLLSSCLLSEIGKIRMYKTIILSVILYGSETWSLISLDEHSLDVFENRVLKRIFGPRSDE
jgi:hypothetical protein